MERTTRMWPPSRDRQEDGEQQREAKAVEGRTHLGLLSRQLGGDSLRRRVPA
jgi:hypothetical protein